MNNGLTSRAVILPLLTCSLLLLGACAATIPKAVSIEERALARWEALFAGDFAAAYAYLSPGYRSSLTVAQYELSVLQNRIRWVSAKYIKSECTETSCNVKINIGYTATNVLPGVDVFRSAVDIEEAWLRLDGQWYLVPGH